MTRLCPLSLAHVPCHLSFSLSLVPCPSLGTIAEESVLDVYESVMDCQVGHRNAELYVWPIKYAELLQLAGMCHVISFLSTKSININYEHN